MHPFISIASHFTASSCDKCVPTIAGNLSGQLVGPVANHHDRNQHVHRTAQRCLCNSLTQTHAKAKKPLDKFIRNHTRHIHPTALVASVSILSSRSTLPVVMSYMDTIVASVNQAIWPARVPSPTEGKTSLVKSHHGSVLATSLRRQMLALCAISMSLSLAAGCASYETCTHCLSSSAAHDCTPPFRDQSMPTLATGCHGLLVRAEPRAAASSCVLRAAASASCPPFCRGAVCLPACLPPPERRPIDAAAGAHSSDEVRPRPC